MVALEKGTVSAEEFQSLCEALHKMPELVGRLLKENDAKIQNLSKYFRLATNVLFCGCGLHFPVALEGALKLKEISYIHAEGFPAAEIKHGPLALVTNFMPVFIIAMRSDPAYEQILTNHQELKAQG